MKELTGAAGPVPLSRRALALLAAAIALLICSGALQVRASETDSAVSFSAVLNSGLQDSTDSAETTDASAASEADNSAAAAAAAYEAAAAAAAASSSSAAAEDPSLPAAPQCEIVYLFDDGAGGFNTYTVTSEIAMSMMTTNEDGSYYIDSATGYYVCDYTKMQAFFSGLDALFPQEGAVNTTGFVTTAGDVIAEYDGSFQRNNVLDVDTEIAYLSVAIMEQRSEAHFPTYTTGGGTYIEIDISNQTLYYYEEGTLMFTCPVVTGCVSAGHSTPTGVYSVRGKARNQTLKGSGYTSFVSYWMNFIGNSHGIHDASWRSSFGGDIYLTNGSHGCVNVPTSRMPELYEMVEVGTPVVLY